MIKKVQEGEKKNFSNKLVLIILVLVIVIMGINIMVYLVAMENIEAKKVVSPSIHKGTAKGIVSITLLPPEGVEYTDTNAPPTSKVTGKVTLKILK